MSIGYSRKPVHQFSLENDTARPLATMSSAPHPTFPAGPHTQDPGFFYEGTAGNDAQAGSSGDDGFDYSQGGNDSLDGREGDDEFHLGATLDKFDSINGGTGHDILFLDGEYDAPVDYYLATTLVSIEEIRLAAGHFYRFGLNDGNVAAGETLTVDGHLLGPDDGFGFFGQAETNGHFVIYGGKGGDGLFVGYGADVVDAHGGDDVVWCPDSSLQLKTLTGGDGFDTAAPQLSGGAVMVLSDTTLKGFERILLQPHANLGAIGVTLNMADGNVVRGQTFVIAQQGTTGTTVALYFDGSAETNGRFEVHGFGGDDSLTGGAGDDDFETSGFGGGTDQVYGGGGNDIVRPWETCDATDIFDGGAGTDTLELRGDYSGGLVFGVDSLVSVEVIDLLNVASYALEFNDGNIARNKSMTVDASGLFGANAVWLDASAETDGFVTLLGSQADDGLRGGGKASTLRGNAGNDTIVGGAGRDTIFGGTDDDTLLGGGNGDVLNGGNGHDWYELGTVAQSTGLKFDELVGFNAAAIDTIALFNIPVTGIDQTVLGGNLRDGNNFNHDLADAVGKHELAAHHAVLFAPDAGNFAGETFLIVDANGRPGYQANKDFVALLTNAAHLDQLDTTDFAVSA